MTITPEDIQIKRHLFDAFGHYETEISAQWLIRFAQQRGKGWKAFTYARVIGCNKFIPSAYAPPSIGTDDERGLSSP